MVSQANGSIEAALHAAIDGGALAGCAAAAATRDGVLFTGGCGRADVEKEVAMRSDTLFRIASMTKAVTSVAVMQLVERGSVSLDDAAAVHVAELAQVQVLDGFAADGTPRLRAPASAPTVRQLLAHTAGWAYEMWNEQIVAYQAKTGDASVFQGGAGFLAAPLVSDPGTRWEYSIATDWLGRLVERVSDVSLDAYFREHILQPLGMDDTAFELDDAGHARLVAVQHRGADGSLVQQDTPVVVRDGFFSGGGGLVSTAPDYLRFTRMLLHDGALDGARILSPESVRQMSESQLGTLRIEPLRTTDPAATRDVEFFPGTPLSWGLGFLINEAPLEGRRAAGSLSWAGIFNSYYWIDPASGVCGVVLMQLLPFFDPHAVALYDAFERAVYRTLRDA